MTTTATLPRTHAPSESSALIAAFTGSLLLAFSPIFVRWIQMEPMAIGFWRMVFSLPMLWIWRNWEKSTGRCQNPKLSLSTYAILIMSGVFFAGDIGLWNLSLDYTSVANSSLFNNFAVFFIPVAAWVLYRERPTFALLVATVGALVGAYFLTLANASFDFGFSYGDALAILASACFAGYLVIVKIMRRQCSTTQIMWWSLFGAILSLGAMTWVRGESFLPTQSQDLWLCAGLAFVVQIGAQGLLAVAMGRLSATYTTLLMFLAPIASASLACLIFGEVMSLVNISGGALILASIYWVQRSGMR